jgi:hypothetical protein
MNQDDKYIIDELEHAPIPMPSDSYFEALKKNVLNEINNERSDRSKQTRIIPMYQRWYVWGSAAAILAFLFLFPWNNSNPETTSNSVNLSSVSNEEIYDYLTENIEDLDAETIALHLSDEVLSDPETEKSASTPENQEDFTSKSPLLEHINNEEILDYLDDESGELDEYLLIES